MKANSPKYVVAGFVLLVAFTLAWLKWVDLPWAGTKGSKGSRPVAAPLRPPVVQATAEQLRARNEEFKKEVQTVLKVVAGLELPASVSEVSFDQGFRMAPQDARQLIESFKTMAKKRVSIPGLLDGVTVTEKKTERPETRFRFTAGYYRISIYPESGAGTKVGRSEGFDQGDDYTFLLDPQTGWAKWWFTPANVYDE